MRWRFGKIYFMHQSHNTLVENVIPKPMSRLFMHSILHHIHCYETWYGLSFTYCVTIVFCAMLFGTNNLAEDGGEGKGQKID